MNRVPTAHWGWWIGLGLSCLGWSCAHDSSGTSGPTTFVLDGTRAKYRDYRLAPVGICDSDAKTVQEELASTNAVIRRFLELSFPPDFGELWTSERMAAVEDAALTLGKVLEVHEHNLRAVEECSFAQRRSMPEIRREGRKLISSARTRIPNIDGIVAHMKARSVSFKWEGVARKKADQARSTCGRLSKRAPHVYFASTDARGRSSWLFCDGVEVLSEPGVPPKPIPPQKPGQKPRFSANTYLQAAKDHPEARVEKAPPLPPLPALVRTER
jgi:hypothetical protein